MRQFHVGVCGDAEETFVVSKIHLDICKETPSHLREGGHDYVEDTRKMCTLAVGCAPLGVGELCQHGTHFDQGWLGVMEVMIELPRWLAYF